MDRVTIEGRDIGDVDIVVAVLPLKFLEDLEDFCTQRGYELALRMADPTGGEVWVAFPLSGGTPG